MSKNDTVIVSLKTKIDEKRAGLGTEKRFVPKTNCSLELDGIRYNLHTITEETAVYLQVKLRTLIDAGYTEFGNTKLVIVGGFSLQDWYEDVKAKTDIVKFRDKMTELKALEKKLDQLMSEDKRTEIALDEIMKQLG